jgi:hypothetical protein
MYVLMFVVRGEVDQVKVNSTPLSPSLFTFHKLTRFLAVIGR